MNPARSKGRLLLLLSAVLLALFIIRPGANGLRKRVVNTIGIALGRRVEVQWVKLRILPQPGFDLENFIVYDDPRFGAEPMLRASEVTASLRLRSLLRGRLEVGRLSLKEPSFNLVRNREGHWNIEALLDRAAHTPAAPTSHINPEHRPVFPYIEAETARINFKIEQEKKSYSLTEADFSLWLESENEWGMRLRARPVRTDFNLSDTGVLHLEGTWQRSGTLRETPLKFTLTWERAQLGQFTKLLSGKDKGWRGGLTLSSTLSGTPADLTLSARATLEDFRRFDIVSSESLRLAAECSARYSSVDHSVSNLLCQAPLKQGTLIVAGTIHAPTGPRSYDLELLAQDIPLQPLVALAQRSKKDLPDDLTGKGLLNATLSMRSDAVASRLLLSGSGVIEDLHLSSASTKSTLSAEQIPLLLSSAVVSNGAHPTKGRNEKGNSESPDGARLDIGPAVVAFGGTSTTHVTGWATGSAYTVLLEGESHVQRLLEAGRTFGFAAPAVTADGVANLHLQIAGNWAEFARPEITGAAQLRSVRADMRTVGPLEIRAANLLLAKDSIRLENLSALAAGSHWSGSLNLPRACAAPCPARVDLQADAIFVDRLNSWLRPQSRKSPWYRVLSSGKAQGPSLLKSLNAVGSISADRVVFRGLEATKVSAQIDLDAGKISLKSVTGNVLGGTHAGTWLADLSVTPPAYSGSGQFEHVSMSDLAQAMHDGWISGTGKAGYRFSSSGTNLQDAVKSASATLDFEVQNTAFPHIALTASAPRLRLGRFSGQLVFREGEFRIEQTKLETTDGVYKVSGTATISRKVDIKMIHGPSRGFAITGTLSEPRVTAVASTETQAALKP